MPTERAVAWVERSAWIAIYVGILAVILGVVGGAVHTAVGWSLGVLGAIAVATGIVLIVVRSRMPEAPRPAGHGAQSDPPQGSP
jgi:hypothetical protein